MKKLILILLCTFSAFGQVRIEVTNNYFRATNIATNVTEVNAPKSDISFYSPNFTDPTKKYKFVAKTGINQGNFYLWTDFRTSAGVRFLSQADLNTWLSENTGVLSSGSGTSTTPTATEANQNTTIALLGLIEARMPILNNLNVPVQLPAGQISALTPPAAISGFALEATQTAGNTTLTALNAKFLATNTIGIVNAGTGFQTNALTDTQLRATPLPINTSASTNALQTDGNTILTSINTKTPTNPSTDRTTAAAPYANRLSDGTAFYDARTIRPLIATDVVTANAGTGFQTNALTDAQLRTTPLPINTSASTNALQTDGNTILTSINTKIPTNPSTDRTTAAAPYANRLSDGTAFYDARTIRPLIATDVVTANAGTGFQTNALTDAQLRATAVPFNQTQINGIAIAVGAGTQNTGTQRVVLTTDTVIQTNVANTAVVAALLTITVGGTAQVLFALNTNRKFYQIVNNSTAVLWLNETGTAAANVGFPIAANGGYFKGFSTNAISVLGATTGQIFYATQN